MSHFYIAYTDKGGYESKLGATPAEFAEDIFNGLLESDAESTPSLRALTKYDAESGDEKDCGAMLLGFVEGRIEDLFNEAMQNRKEEIAHEDSFRYAGKL